MRIFDSFRKNKVELVPLRPGSLGMYLCGLTVQGSPHIGHARSAINFDVVARYFRWLGWKVTSVRNITDIDDKIIAKAAEAGVTPAEHAARYAAEYHHEMRAVGNVDPDVEPRVTDNIPQILALIERLVAVGKAYPAGGDVYYAVETFPDYGKLSGQSIDELRVGARVEPGEHKRNPLDFALWKGAKPGEPQWPSPWGPGRPGWHIECSAMILATLGETFDIHAGGKDLVFPHHENEIAQSQGALGPGTFARHWMHNGMLMFNGRKMSKSLGNVFLVADMRRNFDGETLRLYMVQNHYRSPINLEYREETEQVVAFPGLEEAERRLDYFYTTLQRLDEFLGGRVGAADVAAGELIGKVRAAMDDDFNTALAVAELHEAVKAANKLLDDPKALPKDARRRALAQLSRDLRDAGTGALGLLGQEPREFLRARRERMCAARGIRPADIDARLAERDAARKSKDFVRADALRAELRALGIEVMDTPRGADWRVSE
jgi:cysteinyl-tRNA synthetase